MIDLKTKRVTVIGGKGFLGKHRVKKLKENYGCKNAFIADLPEYYLRALDEV